MACGKTVPQAPGVMQRKTLVPLPVNNENRNFNFRRQPNRTYGIHFKAVKDIHPKHDHGSQQHPENNIDPAIQAAQPFFGPCIAPLQKEKPNLIRHVPCRENGSGGAHRMAIKQYRLTQK